MCNVNVTEFRNNIFHYLNMITKESINITKNGEVVAVLSSPESNYYNTLIRLCGCLKDDEPEKSYDEMIGEEILKRCGF